MQRGEAEEGCRGVRQRGEAEEGCRGGRGVCRGEEQERRRGEGGQGVNTYNLSQGFGNKQTNKQASK